jgi:hypothetical protein
VLKDSADNDIAKVVTLKGFELEDQSLAGAQTRDGGSLNGTLTFPGHGAKATWSPAKEISPNSTLIFPGPKAKPTTSPSQN